MKSEHKQFIKVFLVIFIFSFIMVNWDEVSWVFNYQEVYGLTYAFFNPYPDQNQTLVSNINLTNPYVQTINANTAQAQEIHDTNITSLQIPAIGVDTSVVMAQSTDPGILAQDLDQGATVYPGSASPTQNGQIVILGHSAPPHWPRIKHDYIFTDLQNLVPGDQIMLYSQTDQYIYVIKSLKVIPRGGDITSDALNGQNNILILVSCFPPGKNIDRMTVTAELVKK